MISKLPWKLDENDPSIIYDGFGEIIAKDYKFMHVDDFEFITTAINFLYYKKEAERRIKQSL